MKDAWINPNGKIIEIEKAEHDKYAFKLLKKELGLEGMLAYLNKINEDYPYQILHKRGWIRIKISTNGHVNIMGDCINLTKLMKNTMDPAMNITQLRVVKKICKENGINFLRAINDQRFW